MAEITEQEHRELLEISQKIVMAIAHKKYLAAIKMTVDRLRMDDETLSRKLEAIVERMYEHRGEVEQAELDDIMKELSL